MVMLMMVLILVVVLVMVVDTTIMVMLMMMVLVHKIMIGRHAVSYDMIGRHEMYLTHECEGHIRHEFNAFTGFWCAGFFQ